MNRALAISGEIPELVRILENRNDPINRHVLKSFYGEDRAIFDRLKPQLSSRVLQEIEDAALRYYNQKA